MMRFMLYYMYEGKPHTLQDLRMQYQLPCGMVSQIQTKGFDQGINIKARYLDKNLSKICEDNKYNHKVLQSKLSGYYSRKNELYKQQHPEKFVKKQNSEEQAASAT